MTSTSPLESYAQSVLARAPVRSSALDRRERVIASTLIACSKAGPLELKITEIADAAGVSTASVYKDFVNGGDVLTSAILRAFNLLLLDWALETAPQSQLSNPVASVSEFLIKFGETYRHAYSNWLLRADLAMSATDSDEVRRALIAFQDHIISYGILCLPKDALGFMYPRDLLQILIGAVQVHIVRAQFETPTQANANLKAEPNATHLDLPLVVKNILRWITQAPAQSGFGGTKAFGSLDQALHVMHQSKSAVETYAEMLLARTGARSDVTIRRDKMMAATMQHCATHGIEAASVAKIAKLAGVSTASVYREFDNKTALIKASVGRFLPLYAKATISSAEVEDPVERIKSLLAAQVITLTDPFGAWLYRYYVKLEAQQNDQMKAAGLAARAFSDQFWDQQIERLEEEGYLFPTDHNVTRTMLFGAVHRRSVHARVLHQNDETVWAEVQASIGAATHMLFRLYGTFPNPKPTLIFQDTSRLEPAQ